MLKSKCISILMQSTPVLAMIGLIAVVKNDYYLTVLYLLIIFISLVFSYQKGDYKYLLFGFFIMIISEYIFISTGVETFMRNSLFGIMPLWLPILWAYAFLVMKRSIIILGDRQVS